MAEVSDYFCLDSEWDRKVTTYTGPSQEPTKLFHISNLEILKFRKGAQVQIPAISADCWHYFPRVSTCKNFKFKILGLSKKNWNAIEIMLEQLPWEAIDQITILHVRFHHVPNNQHKHTLTYSDYHRVSK